MMAGVVEGQEVNVRKLNRKIRGPIRPKYFWAQTD